LETGRFTLSDVQCDLEAGVQDIEKTIGETPHEEEDGNKRDGDDGLAGSDLRSAGELLVRNTLAMDLRSHGFICRWTTFLLLVNLIEARLLIASDTEELDHGDGSSGGFRCRDWLLNVW